jgi:pimeloyl-ACP methyl ester carboxylesterase
MPFVAVNGWTEEGTSKTANLMGTTVHYHDVGSGDPLLMLHSYGPGTTAWITWYKVLPEFAKYFRCIAMDLPNFAKTGPIVHEVHGSVHAYQAQMGIALMEHLGFNRFHVMGNSQGGQTAMEMSWMYPEKVNKMVWGAGHAGVGVGMYLISNRPEEGIRASGIFTRNPTVENMRNYLELHIHDTSLITDELAEYLMAGFNRQDLKDARAQIKPSAEPYPDNHKEMQNIKAPTLVVWGRDDRTCTFEIGIEALNAIPDCRLVVFKNTRHWVPFEQPEQYAATVVPFLRGYDVEVLKNEPAMAAAGR